MAIAITWIERLHREMADCVLGAKRQGWTGHGYDYTAEDCASIAEALDDAGLPVEPRNARSLESIRSACLQADMDA